MAAGSPLAGVVVLDLARMLPGAVVARMLADLGARVIKVEEPSGGDPFRHAPPLVEGIGAGFRAFYRGAESVALDLARPSDAVLLRALARHADVLVESFRPGTLEAWDLGPGRLRAVNPSLVVCSLTGFGRRDGAPKQAAHDLNVVALSGALDRLTGERFGSERLAGVQLADVGAGLLACSAVLAALLARARTGAGDHLDQPLLAGPLPFLLWSWADAAAGGPSLTDTLLAGECPAYRIYRCADGKRLAVAALEPKFWADLVALLDLPDLAGGGLESGDAGRRVADEVAARFATADRHHWLSVLGGRGLPVSAVHSPEQARGEPAFAAAGLLEEHGAAAAGPPPLPGPFLPSLGVTPARPAPRLGEHTQAVLESFGLRAKAHSAKH